MAPDRVLLPFPAGHGGSALYTYRDLSRARLTTDTHTLLGHTLFPLEMSGRTT